MPHLSESQANVHMSKKISPELEARAIRIVAERWEWPVRSDSRGGCTPHSTPSRRPTAPRLREVDRGPSPLAHLRDAERT